MSCSLKTRGEPMGGGCIKSGGRLGDMGGGWRGEK